MKIVVPIYIKQIMDKINKLGYDVYLVGGYVRDTILNVDCNDYDLVTSMPLEKVSLIVPNFRIMKENKNRNVGISKVKNITIEISTMHGDNILKDLSNRDFTINAMCANASGNVIDPFNGELDLKYKKIRLVDESGNSLKKDPIRILRALRLSYSLGFDIDSETYELLLQNRQLLNNCATERIFKEFSKIIICNNPGDIIRRNKEIITTFIPELSPMIGFNQDNPYHVYDVFMHTMIVLNNTKPNLTLRIAALFHDAGKPFCKTIDSKGIGHFLNHQKYSIEEFKKFSKRMHLSYKKSKEIISIIYYHDMILGVKESSMNKFLSKYEYDLDLLFDLKVADIKGQNPNKLSRVEEIEELRNAYKNYLATKPPIKVEDLKINGYTLQKMNYHGKEIGIILDDVLSKVISKKIKNEKDVIEDYILENYE